MTWHLVRCRDLKKPIGKCQKCGRTVRYVHHLQKDGETIRVGAICAKRLCGTSYNPKQKEQSLRNILTRRGRWLSRDWKKSKKRNHNPYLSFEENGVTVVITIFRDQIGHYGFWWKIGTEDGFGNRKYETKDGAKMGSFDFLSERLGW